MKPAKAHAGAQPVTVVINNDEPEKIEPEPEPRCEVCGKIKHCHNIWYDSTGTPQIENEFDPSCEFLCIECMEDKRKKLQGEVK